MSKCQVKERPIPLLDHEICAILEDRQTQLRLVVDPQPVLTTARGTQIIGDEFHEWPAGIVRRKSVLLRHMIPKCPYGVVGDRLWVQEAWAKGTPLMGTERTYYKADEGTKRCDGVLWSLDKWRPSIDMSRSDSRLLLENIEVWVERVQEITTEDILAEGFATTLRGHDAEVDLRMQRRVRWNILNAKRGLDWEKNPFVWGIKFRRVE